MKTINHEYYVSFEVAKLLREAVFDWKCTAEYTKKGDFIYILRDTIEWEDGEIDWNSLTKKSAKLIGIAGCENGYSAPTLDVAQRWLREKKGYYIAWEFNMNINSWGQELYDFTDISVYIFIDSEQGNICKCKLKENYKTIEEALEAGEKKALELILEKEEKLLC